MVSHIEKYRNLSLGIDNVLGLEYHIFQVWNIIPVEIQMADDVMTTQEAADYLGITQRSVNGLINRGRLEARKIGIQWLISRESVERYKAEKNRRKSE